MSQILLAIVPVLLLGACATGSSSGLSASNQVSTTQEHERRACAAMGIAPGSGQFSRCVTNLDQTLSDDSRVGQG